MFFLTACSAKFNNPATSKSTTIENYEADNFPPRLVFGQPSFGEVVNLQKGLQNPNRVFSDGKRLFVSDGSKNRVMIYNSIPNGNYTAPSVILGKPFVTNIAANYGGVTNKSLSNPSSIFVDGERLYISDTSNNRVLIWNTVPTSDYTPADIVLGQADFNSNLPNRGGLPDRNTLSSPVSILIIGSKLIVADRSNHRVLIWNDKSTLTNGANADLVLGKNVFNSSAAVTPRTAATLHTPNGLASDGTKLLISDSGNNRILIFNTIPVSSGASANFVMGQNAMNAFGANFGGLSASSLSAPGDITIVQGKIYLADVNNERVLSWNSIPAANNVAANFIFGQDSFTSALGCNKGGTIAKADTVCNPSGVHSDGTRFFVVDQLNNRVLMWKSLPVVSNTPAELVQGQPDLTPFKAANGTLTSATGPYSESKVAYVSGNRLYTSHGSENRVLVWNSIPTSSNQAPDFVLGQPDFSSNAANNDANGISARTLKNPRAIWSDGTRLAITDLGNHRILIWNKLPTQSYTPADLVLGQPDFTSSSSNQGGTPTARTLSSPETVESDGKRLIIADSGNHRILIWNSFPQENSAPADVVIGQPNKTSNTADNGGMSAKSLQNPKFLTYDSTTGKLIVHVYGNSRILIWNSIPTTDFAAADVVLGQPDFTSFVSRIGVGANLRYLGGSEGIRAYKGRLYVAADDGKILVWNTIPTTNFAPADSIFGAIAPTYYGPSEFSFGSPIQMSITDQYIFFGDRDTYRVTAVPHYPVGFYSHNETPSLVGQLTANDCTNIAALFVNEDSIPSAQDSGWQNCSTAPGAIQFKLKDATEGVRILKVWRKNSEGRVMIDPIQLPLVYDVTPPLSPPSRISSGNPSASANITIANGGCSDTPFVYISESNATPAESSSAWRKCATSLTYTLQSQTGSARPIYVWGKDRAGNVSALPSTFNVTY